MVVLNIKELLEVYNKEKQKVDKYSSDKLQDEYIKITKSDGFKEASYQQMFEFLYNFYSRYIKVEVDVQSIVEKILKKKKLKLDVYSKVKGTNEDYIKFYKYKPVKIIGSGAFGQVYLVKKNKKTFACKVQWMNQRKMNQRKMTDNIYQKQINDWLYEFKIGTKVGKENIGPKIYNIHFIYDKTRNILYNIIIMEHIDGVTLETYIGDNTLTTTHIKLLDTTINKLHKLGIVHGDLHRNNIIVVSNKKTIRFCIIDYGRSGNKKKILNREYDYNKHVVKFINNNKYDALTLIVTTHLLDNNTIEIIQ